MNASKTLSLFSRLLPVARNLQVCKTYSAYFSSLPFKVNATPELFRPNFNTNVYRLCGVFTNVQTSVRCISDSRLRPHRDTSDGTLTKAQAGDLVLKLTEEERNNLFDALQEFEANKIKSEYEGQLAATRWRSKYGRPSKLPTLGDVDPTGTYCQLSEDWLKKKYGELRRKSAKWNKPQISEDGTEHVPPPNLNQLIGVAVHNAVPFIGFGFLDNFIMIIAGDYIELSLGSVITISTMAAAALGNTISDVMGIGSAWYVELIAAKVGLKSPDLSPIQLDMKSARRFANLGRAIGIVVGCLLGMFPLLFMNNESLKSEVTPNESP